MSLPQALVRPNTVETAQNYYLLNNMKWMQHVFMDSHVYSQKEIKSVRIPRQEFLEMLSLDLSVKDGEQGMDSPQEGKKFPASEKQDPPISSTSYLPTHVRSSGIITWECARKANSSVPSQA